MQHRGLDGTLRAKIREGSSVFPVKKGTDLPAFDVKKLQQPLFKHTCCLKLPYLDGTGWYLGWTGMIWNSMVWWGVEAYGIGAEGIIARL